MNILTLPPLPPLLKGGRQRAPCGLRYGWRFASVCLVVLIFTAMPLAGALSAYDDLNETASELPARPPKPEPVNAADLEAALGRGVDYLLQHQNKDGSWGSPAL